MSQVVLCVIATLITLGVYATLAEKCTPMPCPKDTMTHCLFTKDWDPVIVCAPVKMMKSGMCPSYDTKTREIGEIKCPDSDGRGSCPTENYLSNQGMNYKNCMGNMTNVSNMTFIGNTTERDANTTFPPELIQSSPTTVAIIVPTVVVLISAVTTLVVCFIMKRKIACKCCKRGSDDQGQPHEEIRLNAEPRNNTDDNNAEV